MGKGKKIPTLPFDLCFGQIKLVLDKCVDFFSFDNVPLLIIHLFQIEKKISFCLLLHIETSTTGFCTSYNFYKFQTKCGSTQVRMA